MRNTKNQYEVIRSKWNATTNEKQTGMRGESRCGLHCYREIKKNKPSIDDVVCVSDCGGTTVYSSQRCTKTLSSSEAELAVSLAVAVAVAVEVTDSSWVAAAVNASWVATEVEKGPLRS